MQVELFTDGAARGNPGRGGYGAILCLKKNGEHAEKELSQGFRLTTNNRMELMAVIAGLEALQKPCEVLVFSDSQYVVQAHKQGWLKKWQEKGWRGSDKKAVKNIDLWKRLVAAEKPHTVHYEWVKGHAGNEYNERCDALATSAADLGPHTEDDGFLGFTQASLTW